MHDGGILRDKNIYIIDVGASGGLHPRWQKIARSNFKAVLFEPDPREFGRLRQTLGDQYIVINSALSDSPQELKFHLCRMQQTSSIFPPNFELLKHYPEFDRFDVLDTIKIKTDTVDAQLKKAGIEAVDFIKIDAQGYELSILRGADQTLERVTGLEIEVEFLPIYKDQPLFPEVDRFTTGRGFELIDLKRYYWRKVGAHRYGAGQKGQIVFGDALYFRTPEDICTEAGVDDERILRSLAVYMAYGYFDFADALFNLSSEKGILSGGVQEHIRQYLKGSEKFALPNFKGKGHIERAFKKMADLFTIDYWASGSDEKIGNC